MVKKILQKTLNFISFYLIPITLITISIYNRYFEINQYDLFKNYGDYAFKLLIFILFISPLNSFFNYFNKSFPNKYGLNERKIIIKHNLNLKELFYSIIISLKIIFNFLILNRKQLGLISFYFALFHSIGMIFYYKLFLLSYWKVLNINQIFVMITGIIAFIGMLILGLTSNKFSMMKLKLKWKKIQRIVYPTFVLVIIHKYLLEFDLGPLIILFTYIILKYFQNKIK